MTVIFYNQSKALTKEVNKNGNTTQNHSGSNIRNAIVIKRKTKKAIHQVLVFVFAAVAMVLLFIGLQM